MKALIALSLMITPIASGSVGVSSSNPNPSPTPKPAEDSIMVTMTTYTVSRSQTDSNPYETASGFILNKKNPKQHRVIAISRDLRDTFAFGDSVYVEAGKYSGTYVVHDVMNKRFKKKIDLLINPKDKGDKIDGVTIKKL
jgi:3D (Asp-Asp-Asp) domain-containing protein